jgi:hypothetical protein
MDLKWRDFAVSPQQMLACQIEEYHDSATARDELVPWLIASDAEPVGQALWRQRLAHWWDANPFAPLAPSRGWVLRHEGNIVGFMGLIPAGYAAGGEFNIAYIASTWRVDEAHRNASLPMLIKLRRLAASTLMADTSPTLDVQLMLQKCGWLPATSLTRHFLPFGFFSMFWAKKWPQLPAGKRFTRDPAEVRTTAASFQRADRIEKWITPEYLSWLIAAPKRRHEFFGVLDEAGCLTSYLILTRETVRGVPTWVENDHFTVSSSTTELYALVGELVRNPSLLGSEPALSLTSFPGDRTWDDAPCPLRREARVTHHFSIPESLKLLPKHSVLAEGDLGL